MNAATTQETLQKMREALAKQIGGENLPADLQKNITQATGLVWFDLQAPALSLVPVLTPMRNEIPRVSGRGGTGANWKAITGINTALVDASVSEGNRGGLLTTSVVSKLANYKGIGLEDYVTFEADYAAENFQDVKATAALNTLRATMIQEEFLILAGNTSLALGTTPTPSVSTSTSGGSIATTTVVSVIAVALTPDGFRRSNLTTGGVPAGAIARTNADGSSDNINPGVAIKSAGANVTTGAGSTNSVSASVTPVTGAVGYAWYWGTVGNEKLGAISTINSILITVATGAAAANQLASALSSSDLSQNALAFDGFLTQAWNSGAGAAYISTQPTGTLGTGTPLTSDGASGIVEFTTAFLYFWNNFRLGPQKVWLNAQELINITKKVIANGGAPLLRVTDSAERVHTGLAAGVVVDSILNPITSEPVKLQVHPNMPAGTLLFDTTTIPYPMNGVANVRQVKCRQDYYQIEWPRRSRKYEYGVYADEVLQHYFPSALGIISNIANG